MTSETGPKRVAEGVATRHDDESCEWWSLNDDDGVNLTSDVNWFEGFDGKRVRITVENVDNERESAALPHEVDVDGIVSESQRVRYIGKATRQPNGKYIALAEVDGCLCRVECVIDIRVEKQEASNG